MSVTLVLLTALPLVPVVALLGFVGCAADAGNMAVDPGVTTEFSGGAQLELFFTPAEAEVREVQFEISRESRRGRQEPTELVIVDDNPSATPPASSRPEGALSVDSGGDALSEARLQGEVKITVRSAALARWRVRCRAEARPASTSDPWVWTPWSLAEDHVLVAQHVETVYSDGTATLADPTFWDPMTRMIDAEPNAFKFRLFGPPEGFHIEPVRWAA